MHIKLETSATRSDRHGFADSELPLDSAPQDINDIIKEDRFDVTLSVSKREVRSKTDGGKVIEFEQRTVNTADKAALVAILTSRNYSTNQWNGTCSNANYIGTTGVTLDFDDQLSLEGARQRFAPYNYILHTSSSHRVLKNGQVADRFRVILPFEPGGLRFCTIDQSYKVYDAVLKLNPEADPGCKDPGRKYFPHTNELGAEFILEVNSVGKYFEIDISDMPDKVVSTKVRTDYLPPEELNTREELDRMMKFCPFMQWCQAEAENGLPEPLWYAMISNLCRFTEGRELIHKISAADPVVGRYDFDETEDKIQQAFENSGPICYETIVRDGWPGVAPAAPLAPAGWAKLGRIVSRAPFGDDGVTHLLYDDILIVKLKNGWVTTNLDDVKTNVIPETKTVDCNCPFCDAGNAEMYSDCFNFVHLDCPSCTRKAAESPLAPNLFIYRNQVLRVEQREGEFSSIEVLTSDHFRTKEDYSYARKYLANSAERRFLDDNFQIRRIGDASMPGLSYEFVVSENAVVFKYPALPVDIEDNAFIENFLRSVFGNEIRFIQEWLAMYSYTNYVTLPVIVLAGERGTGKGTFANLVWSIFPTLAGHWTGDVGHFNENYRCKLLFVDENKNSDKPTQYTEIKKITGNPVVRINEKYKPEYNVPNNIKIIMATNDPRPIFLKSEEQPTSESNNNFFIYKCPNLTGPINEELGAELKKRLGHYVRTVLKDQYEALQKSRGTGNRYAIQCPVTSFAKDLFTASKTTLEIESEELAETVVRSTAVKDVFGLEGGNKIVAAADSQYYIKQSEIRDLIRKAGFTGSSNTKAYINHLQNHGVISYESDHRTSGERLGYRILRNATFYTKLPVGEKPAASNDTFRDSNDKNDIS